MAEIRKQALIASGVQIEGLQQASAGGAGGAPKKVVYGNRKKKGPAGKAPGSRSGTPDPSTPVNADAESSDEEAPVVQAATPKPANGASPSKLPADNSPKDDWDASSGDENDKASPTAGVKDAWDASSDEETEKVVPKTSVQQPKPSQGSMYCWSRYLTHNSLVLSSGTENRTNSGTACCDETTCSHTSCSCQATRRGIFIRRGLIRRIIRRGRFIVGRGGRGGTHVCAEDGASKKARSRRTTCKGP